MTLPTGRRQRCRDLELPRRPLPLPAGLRRLPPSHRARRRRHLPRRRRPPRPASQRPLRQRHGVHHPLRRRPRRTRRHRPQHPQRLRDRTRPPRRRAEKLLTESSANLRKSRTTPPTLKKWLAAQPDQPATIAELQVLLEVFAPYYNQQRPHRSLDRRTPAATYHARPKATPTATTPEVAPDARVRRDRVDTSGVVTLRYDGRLHHIGIGRTHARTHVLLLVQDRQIRVINEHTRELPPGAGHPT